MELKQAIELARKGIKMTHEYFGRDEYLTVQGNMVFFEDGVKIFLNEWIKDKEWLNNGWSEYKY